MFEVQDNRNPGSTTADAEIWSYAFPDNFSGWQQSNLPFSAFARKEIGNGAPNDGFGLTVVHAWAFGILTNPGPLSYYIEDVATWGRTALPPPRCRWASPRSITMWMKVGWRRSRSR